VWTLTLPGGRSFTPADPALVTAYRRREQLAPAVTLRTVRRGYELRGADGQLLGEVSDETASVLDGRRVVGRFRAASVSGKGRLKRLFSGPPPVPVHLAVLGVTVEEAPPPETDTAAGVVTAALADGVRRVVAHDPLVRLRAGVGDGDTAVHQMRVGCRRLRSDLRSFAPLLDADWAEGLRAELAWLADVLGEARDAEVLRDRLGHTANADPLAPLDAHSLARIDEALRDRQDAALLAVDAALDSERYLDLLDALDEAAEAPRLTADGPAHDVLPALVRRPWKRLWGAVRGLDEAAPDEVWHAARIRAKRARYALEAVTPALGGTARKLGRHLADAQGLLGDHQDASVAAEVWQAIGDAHPDDHGLAVTVGRLIERERAAVRGARHQFPGVWRAARRLRHARFLR